MSTGQQSLFPDRRSRFRNRQSLARRTDPESSHAAGREVTESGRRDSQKQRVLDAIAGETQPASSLDLAARWNLDRYMVARRLPDLERDGLVERVERAGDQEVLWRLRR